MMRWGRFFSIFLVAVVLALPGTATAGYVAEPMAEEDPGEMHDSSDEEYGIEKRVFWNLSPRAMFFEVMFLAMLLPVCFFPVELFYALSALLTFGYRRVTRRTVLDDAFRHDLYRQIAANPGIDTEELGESTGGSRGRLRYHLNILIREGKVAAVCHRNRIGHFARNQRHTVLEQRILIGLREESSRAMLGCLLESVETGRSDLAERLGISGQTVSCRMQEFEEDGIVVAEREGRIVRYRLSEDARKFLNRHVGALRLPGTANHPAATGAATGREARSG